MPWFPDFAAAVELARRDRRAAGQSDPVAEYLAALATSDAHELEAVWPSEVVVYDPYAGEVRGHRRLRQFVRSRGAWLGERLTDTETVASTTADGRAVVEIHAHLSIDGEAVLWPVAVVAESHDDRSVVFRTYVQAPVER